MANLGIEIKRKCPICGKAFIIKTLDSVYCSPKCSKVANKRKKDKEKKEALLKKNIFCLELGKKCVTLQSEIEERAFYLMYGTLCVN